LKFFEDSAGKIEESSIKTFVSIKEKTFNSFSSNVSKVFLVIFLNNSDKYRFRCRNSKPLPMSEGYWAEPWPVAETPLCAVIDPARDYRWHALRCGGPETAAFLCEMESKFSSLLRMQSE
jgi:hypothetical protein